MESFQVTPVKFVQKRGLMKKIGILQILKVFIATVDSHINLMMKCFNAQGA